MTNLYGNLDITKQLIILLAFFPPPPPEFNAVSREKKNLIQIQRHIDILNRSHVCRRWKAKSECLLYIKFDKQT